MHIIYNYFYIVYMGDIKNYDIFQSCRMSAIVTALN